MQKAENSQPTEEKLLDQESFVEANADETLSDEEKAQSIDYSSLTEEEKAELDEMLRKQTGPKPFTFLKAPRKALTQKELKVRKKKKSISNASRRANRKKKK